MKKVVLVILLFLFGFWTVHSADLVLDTAEDIFVDTVLFNKNLEGVTANVQKMLEAIDEFDWPDSPIDWATNVPLNETDPVFSDWDKDYNDLINTPDWTDTCLTAVNWGDIGGTLANQTDLQAALNLKATEDDLPDTYYTETEIDSLLANKANWDTAYGWGDHAGLYLPLTGGTMSGNNITGVGRLSVGTSDTPDVLNVVSATNDDAFLRFDAGSTNCVNSGWRLMDRGTDKWRIFKDTANSLKFRPVNGDAWESDPFVIFHSQEWITLGESGASIILMEQVKIGSFGLPTNAISLGLDDYIDFGDNAVKTGSDDDSFYDVYADGGIRLHQNTVVTGYVDASAGFKDNGTAGIDTTFTDNDGNTITVSGGIITAKTAP